MFGDTPSCVERLNKLNESICRDSRDLFESHGHFYEDIRAILIPGPSSKGCVKREIDL
jgi:hypothetical protein